MLHQFPLLFYQFQNDALFHHALFLVYFYSLFLCFHNHIKTLCGSTDLVCLFPLLLLDFVSKGWNYVFLIRSIRSNLNHLHELHLLEVLSLLIEITSLVSIKKADLDR